MAPRYEEVELDMAESIVVQTIDTWTGRVVDQRTEWKLGFDPEDEVEPNFEGWPEFNGAFKETR
jgi:hypothetical protein